MATGTIVGQNVGAGKGSTAAAGDLNGDGKPDIAVANPGDNTVTIYTNISSRGTINAADLVLSSSFAAGNGPKDIAIVDIDGDGSRDLVVVEETAGNVAIYRNVSTNALGRLDFALPVNTAVGGGPRALTLADVSGDGRPEIITANGSANTISIILNNSLSGAILVNVETNYSVGNGPLRVMAGDLTGDGRLDLVSANAAVSPS